MEQDKKINDLRAELEKIYEENRGLLLFHGWHHITFVAKKAKEFAESIEADSFIVESAALVHDLNYVVEVNSEPEVGAELRAQVLQKTGYSEEEIKWIEQIVMGEYIAKRGAEVTKEAKALSDADTLFKALPITPILFASKYIEQNKVDISKLANKVVSEQKPLLEQDIYFYTEIAKQKYLHWAKINLELWANVVEALKDEDVQDILEIAREKGIV